MDPLPASSQPALPLCSLSAPRLHYRWVFIPHVMFHHRPPSCGLRVAKSGEIERGTGVWRPRRRAAAAGTLAASSRALYFSCSRQDFDWFSGYSRPLSVPVVKFARQCFGFFFPPRMEPCDHWDASQPQICASVHHISSTPTLDLQIH